MPQPAKFDFGNVFDGLVEEPDAFDTKREPTWNADEVEQEKAAAYTRGSDAGRTDALASIEQRISTALEDVLEKAGVALDRLDAIESELTKEAKLLSVAVGRAVASELLAQSHALEIEAIVDEALGFLTHQPHVVVRVHEDLLDGFRSRLQALAADRGFTGNLIILGEPDMKHADCRIEWAEGGITRDSEALAAKLDEIVRRHLTPSGPETHQDDLFASVADTSAVTEDITEEASE